MISKEEFFLETKRNIQNIGLEIASIDFERPWGGFFVINEKDNQKFIQEFFADTIKIDWSINQKISPKILIVAPKKKLSWQYHHRRSEIWKLIQGEAGIIKSKTDEEGVLERLVINKAIELKQEERHRLVGLNEWGMVAEIWVHTDAQNPSDEDDIVRISDEYGRE